ncbi:ScbR family autoregulator-binding transcription factor [Streptomyces rubiginosohelvolus]|uniref:ScbR family autoregulator-binding transcription factor n=1 Tax=Streptomyces rubiginosohelvolus TaxID=67362 RepID=UPI0035DB9157
MTTTQGGVTVQERAERGERAERREQTALRIVEAAGIVIDRKGYTAASIPEIQDVANVSRGTVYHHFASKEELGDAVLARQASFFEQVAKNAATGAPPALWLQALIEISHQYTASILNDPVLRAAVRLSIEPGPYQTAESYAGPLGAVTAVLDSAREAGELQDHVDPGDAARTLVGCYSGVQLLAMALVERDTLHQQVSAMWSLIMPGLARPDVLAQLSLDPPHS